MTGPLWDGTGVDPFLPARLAAESALTQAERRMYNSWWGSFSSWLVRARRGVLSGVVPDAHAVWAAAPLWAAEMDAFVAGPVTDTVGISFRALFGDGYAYDARPAVTTYLAQVRNRMVRTPEDVYSVVASEVAKGAGAGESIPAIAARVDNVLSVTGTENWRGRAVAVARTEALGALSSGRADAHAAVAEALGGEFEQVWLSTIDRRTRLDHAEADLQRVPVGTPFTVCGEALMFPGDPSGSAGCVINCRCSSVLERVGEKTDMTGRGFSDADEYWASQLGTPPAAAKVAPTSKREAARERARQIEARASVETTLADLDELVHKGAAPALFEQALAAPAGIAAKDVAALRAAVGDPVKMQAQVTHITKEAGITVDAKAGATVKYDPAAHDPVGTVPPDGTPMVVIRRGTSVTIDGRTTVLNKATVKIAPKGTSLPKSTVGNPRSTVEGARSSVE